MNLLRYKDSLSMNHVLEGVLVATLVLVVFNIWNRYFCLSRWLRLLCNGICCLCANILYILNRPKSHSNKDVVISSFNFPETSFDNAHVASPGSFVKAASNVAFSKGTPQRPCCDASSYENTVAVSLKFSNGPFNGASVDSPCRLQKTTSHEISTSSVSKQLCNDASVVSPFRLSRKSRDVLPSRRANESNVLLDRDMGENSAGDGAHICQNMPILQTASSGDGVLIGENCSILKKVPPVVTDTRTSRELLYKPDADSSSFYRVAGRDTGDFETSFDDINQSNRFSSNKRNYIGNENSQRCKSLSPPKRSKTHRNDLFSMFRPEESVAARSVGYAGRGDNRGNESVATFMLTSNTTSAGNCSQASAPGYHDAASKHNAFSRYKNSWYYNHYKPWYDGELGDTCENNEFPNKAINSTQKSSKHGLECEGGALEMVSEELEQDDHCFVSTTSPTKVPRRFEYPHKCINPARSLSKYGTGCGRRSAEIWSTNLKNADPGFVGTISPTKVPPRLEHPNNVINPTQNLSKYGTGCEERPVEMWFTYLKNAHPGFVSTGSPTKTRFDDGRAETETFVLQRHDGYSGDTSLNRSTQAKCRFALNRSRGHGREK